MRAGHALRPAMSRGASQYVHLLTLNHSCGKYIQIPPSQRSNAPNGVKRRGFCTPGASLQKVYLSTPLGLPAARIASRRLPLGRRGHAKGSDVQAQAVIDKERWGAELPLPAGRRSPKGRLRWYAVHVPAGMEASTAARVKPLVPAGLLSDAFSLRREVWFKRGGVWSLQAKTLYPEYFFIESGDAANLDLALRELSFPVCLAGKLGRGWMPLADEVRDWYAAHADASHCVRSSAAVIEDGALHVTRGPLMGQEQRICGIDRHKRTCGVRLGTSPEAPTEVFALDVVSKG